MAAGPGAAGSVTIWLLAGLAAGRRAALEGALAVAIGLAPDRAVHCFHRRVRAHAGFRCKAKAEGVGGRRGCRPPGTGQGLPAPGGRCCHQSQGWVWGCCLAQPRQAPAGSGPGPQRSRPQGWSDAGCWPGACRAEPSVRSYSLVTFWADAGGGSAQRARSPARTSTLRAVGMVRSRRCAAGPRPAF